MPHKKVTLAKVTAKNDPPESTRAAILHAKFRFFDTTPLGQLMNRFSKDIAVDQEVAPVVIGLLTSCASYGESLSKITC